MNLYTVTYVWVAGVSLKHSGDCISMAMTKDNESGNASAFTVENGVLKRVYAYFNKNGNPTVSTIVDVGDRSYTIHNSLVDGARKITEETLRFYGITADHFDSDIEVAVKVKVFEDPDLEPKLLGAPRASDAKALKLLKL